MKIDKQNDWRNFLNDTTMEGTYIDQFLRDRGCKEEERKERRTYA